MNLMIFNMPETTSADDDKKAFNKLIKDGFSIEANIVRTERLGLKKEKPRMMKVQLESVSDKKSILAKAKSLRDSTNDTYSNIFIRPDLTKNQQEASKNLRTQLKTTQEDYPLKKWMIKQGKIIEVTAL